MDKVRAKFNSIPSWAKVLIYAGISQALGVILVNLSSVQDFDWRSVASALIGIVVNILAYLILKEKNEG